MLSIQHMLFCICRPRYLPCSGVACLAGIVYGLSSSNCLCSLSLTINEPNYKLQTTNKPQENIQFPHRMLAQQGMIASMKQP